MANEKRLISVEDTVRQLQHEIYWNDSTKAAIRAFLRTVPAVDAVEVVHGCTISAEQPKTVFLDRKCGICDSLMLSTDAYCPGCGAKMDGGVEDV